MRELRKKFIVRFLIAISLLCLCNSASYGQTQAPSISNKLRAKARVAKKVPPTEIQVPRIPVGAVVSASTPASTSLINASQFASCNKENPCAWSVSLDTPWPFVGMSLDPASGRIVGTPTQIGLAHVQVVATDAAGKSYHAGAFIQVVPTAVAVTTTNTTLPHYPAGQPIAEQLQVDGGTGPYIWTRVEHITLPIDDVTLDALGRLSGTASKPGTYPFKAEVKDLSSSQMDAPILQLVIDAPPDCGNEKYTSPRAYFNGWFPLSRTRNIDPLGHPVKSNQLPTDNDVVCFYSASGLVSVVGKVQYLYGFGGGANTLSADLVSVQMPAPVGTQVSFGSSVTGGGTGTASATPGAGQSQPTVSAALQSVEAGGNFYVHVLYPLAQFTSPHFSEYLWADPRMGFGFNGFANQATLSQGTEQYFSLPIENYASYDGIGNAGGVYFDYRAGFESVPGSFARNAGISHHNFALQQLTFGFNFVGLFRVGAQKFFGPPAAFNAANTAASSFSKWHLIIQLSPKSL